MTPEEHGRRVLGIFDKNSAYYDFLNHFLSAGQDIFWRRTLAGFVRPGPTGRVLDLAAGTLDLSLAIHRRWPDVSVLAMDFSLPMLLRGVRKLRRQDPVFPVRTDGRFLPLPDACVDAVTIGFGIRNILPREEAYAEMLRVLVPGGRLCILEFGTGRARIWGGAYNAYLTRVLPRLGALISGDASAYRYLSDTILAFPDERQLALELMQAGFTRVFYRPMSSGIVYAHIAEKP